MAAVVPDATFEKRMQEAETDVALEFAALDRDLVHREFMRVAENLLRKAKVTDFVPVLARRHVRESLKLLVPAAETAGT